MQTNFKSLLYHPIITGMLSFKFLQISILQTIEKDVKEKPKPMFVRPCTALARTLTKKPKKNLKKQPNFRFRILIDNPL